MASRRKATPKDRPRFTKSWLAKAYWVQGKTLAEIAEEKGVTPAAVWGWMEKFGIERRPTGPMGHGKLDETKVREIRSRLKKGESGQAIAQTLGVTRQTVSLVRSRKIWAHVA